MRVQERLKETTTMTIPLRLTMKFLMKAMDLEKKQPAINFLLWMTLLV